MIFVIAQKELRVMLRSPLTWVLLAVMQVLFTWMHLSALDNWVYLRAQTPDLPFGVTRWLIAQVFAPASTLLLLVGPLLTMRLMADERRTTGMELLLSSPIAPWQIVLGKLLAPLAIFCILVAQMMLLPLSLTFVVSLDWYTLLSALIGLMLICISTCLIGLYFSSLSRHVWGAACGSFGFLALLWILGIQQLNDALGGGFSYLSNTHHLISFLNGMLKSTDVVYYLLLIGIFFLLLVRRVDNFRMLASYDWRTLLQRVAYGGAVLAIAGLWAWLSLQYPAQLDMTAQGRHSLSDSSVAVLESLDGAVQVDVWIGENEQARATIRRKIELYQQYKGDINWQFIDPAKEPQRARQLGIGRGFELVFSLDGRTQRVRSLSEPDITHALVRLKRESRVKVRYVTGHLERQINTVTADSHSYFVDHLRTLGFDIASVDLDSSHELEQIDLLVIAAPRGMFSAAHEAVLSDYVNAGGNVLWLLEYGTPLAPAKLAQELGLSILPGVVVDTAAVSLKLDTPDFVVIKQYPEHPALPQSLGTTLYPQSVGLQLSETDGWQMQPLLASGDGSWTELGELTGQVRYDPGTPERPGPIMIGATLQRALGDAEQRVALIGDADFIANRWLANGSNLYLAQQLYLWLGSHQPELQIEPIRARDVQFELPRLWLWIFGVGMLLLLPIGLLVVAVLVWRNNRFAT